MLGITIRHVNHPNYYLRGFSGNTMCSLLGTSRYLQAAGAQGVLPGVFGLISKRFRTPVFALFYMVSSMFNFKWIFY